MMKSTKVFIRQVLCSLRRLFEKFGKKLNLHLKINQICILTTLFLSTIHIFLIHKMMKHILAY